MTSDSLCEFPKPEMMTGIMSRLVRCFVAVLFFAVPASVRGEGNSTVCNAQCKMTCCQPTCQGIVETLVADAKQITTTEQLSDFAYNVTYRRKYNVEQGFYPFIYEFSGRCFAHGQNPDYVDLFLSQIVNSNNHENASDLNDLFISAASPDAVTHFMTYTWGEDATIKDSYLLELTTSIPNFTTRMYVGSGFFVVACPSGDTTTTTTLPRTTTTRQYVNASMFPTKYCLEYSSTLSPLDQISDAGLQPNGLFIDNAGVIYFLSSNGDSTSDLYQLSAVLGTTKMISNLASPYEIAIDPADLGMLITCPTAIYKVQCIQRNWNFMFCELYDDALSLPTSLVLSMTVESIRGLAVTHESKIFFVDSATGGLYFHDTTSTMLTTEVLSGLSQPYDVAIDEHTFDLFISSIGTAAVYRLPCVNKGESACIDYGTKSDLQTWTSTMQVYSLTTTDNATVIVANSNTRSIISTRNIAADTAATPQVVSTTLATFSFSGAPVPKWSTIDRQTCNIYVSTFEVCNCHCAVFRLRFA